MFAHRISKDGINEPDYGTDGVNYCFSGFYLRGGGLSYEIYTNWDVKI
jgi:hypothetical protein